MNLNPVLTAAIIVVGVSLLGVIISRWRQSHVFRGYEEYASDAQTLAGKLKAEVFRDGIDLIISGNYGTLPTIVRFSYADNTPGLNVKMRAPATFTMSVIPKGSKATGGRVQMRTPDDAFDARFVTRTDYPTEARLFAGRKSAFAQIQKLCCSSQTFLTLASGGIELSELTVPTPYTGHHIQTHLESMAVLAKELQQMPGADAIKITPYRKEHSNIIRAALAVGILTAIVVVVGAMYDHGSNAAAEGFSNILPGTPEGISPPDAPRIPGLSGFRLVTESDFDADAVAWARSQTGHNLSGRIEAAFSAEGAQENAYVLVREAGVPSTKRVTIVAGNETKYDAGYPELAVVGKVPRSNFAGIPWVGTPPPPDGDALLLVRKRNDLRSGIVIYLSGGRTETAVPTNYLNVSIQ